jgi:hypothetical protein
MCYMKKKKLICFYSIHTNIHAVRLKSIFQALGSVDQYESLVFIYFEQESHLESRYIKKKLSQRGCDIYATTCKCHWCIINSINKYEDEERDSTYKLGIKIL